MFNTKTVDYRNAIYQGGLQSSTRQGPGILITDSGRIIIGFWSNDQLDGPFLQLWHSQRYCYGQKRKGLLNQMCIYVQGDNVFLGQFYKGKLQGIYMQGSLSIGKGSIHRVSKQSNSTLKQFNQNKLCSLRQFIILSNVQTYLTQLPSHYCLLSQYSSKILRDLGQLGLQLGSYRYNHIHSYYGYLKDRKPQGLGFIIQFAQRQKLASYGNFSQSQHDGIGRVHINNEILFEGIFKKSILNGQGIKYLFTEDRFIYGLYQNGCLIRLIQQGHGFPTKISKLIKKKIHIQSFYYSGTYAVFIPSPQSNSFRNVFKQSRLKPVKLFSQPQLSKQVIGIDPFEKLLDKVASSLRNQICLQENQLQSIQIPYNTIEPNFITKTQNKSFFQHNF